MQIVESHRHTFSVPSSDDEADSEDEDDEVQIASSVQGGEEEDSAATTPDRQAVGKAQATEGEAQSSETGPASGEIRGLNLKGPTLQEILTETAKDGTSQENPINLEGAYTSAIDVDTESEDDNGPDILPFYESLKADRLDQEKDFYEPQVARQTSGMTLATTTTATEKQSGRDSETRIHRIVPETQVKIAHGCEARGYDPTRVLAETTTGATDDFSSEDDDGFDYDHGFFDEDFEPFREPSDLNVGMQSNPKPKVTVQTGGEKLHYKTTPTPPFDEIRPTRLSHLCVSSDPIDVSQPSEPSLIRAQRAPSPSDAALAKKANDPKTSLGRDIFDKFPEPMWPPAAKTTYSQSTEHALDHAASREERIGAYSWPELQSPEPRSYDQGPFSSQPKVIVPAARSPKPEIVKDQPKKATVTWADPYEDNDDMTMNIDRSAWTGKPASKITIPSLVENYLAENPRSLKRRHEEINGSKDVGTTSNVPTPTSLVTRTSGFKRTFAECSYEEGLPGQQSYVDHTDSTWESGEDKTTQHQPGLVDRDSLLNDAQPREHIFQTPTASLSQDSVPEPALDSVSITTTVQDDSIEGPAPKKARTSSSSSGGIGKFVMGVGFGLLGAAAAFVATIPASVYEEALREFNNAT